MPAFQYQALDDSGRTKKGVLSADSNRVARRKLMESGLTPIQIEVMSMQLASGRSRRQKMSRQDVVAVTRQLATLVSASAPVEEALEAVAHQMQKPAVRSTILAIRSKIVEGWRLSNALAEFPETFSPLYRGIVASGETAGELGTVLGRLADMLEKNRAMALKAITALVYPAVLAVIATLVIVGMMIFIVPRIVEQFETLDASLPLVTSAVVAASDFLQNWGFGLAIFFAILIVIAWRALEVAKVRLWCDARLLQLPIIGKLAAALDTARFARTMSTLFSSRVPMLECIQIATRTVTNTFLKRQLGDTLIAVQEGASLTAGLRRVSSFPPMLSYMVAAGERSGELAGMLEKCADQMEAEFDTATTVALRLLEPVIIVGMGIVIMIIMLAILIPVMQINTLSFA